MREYFSACFSPSVTAYAVPTSLIRGRLFAAAALGKAKAFWNPTVLGFSLTNKTGYGDRTRLSLFLLFEFAEGGFLFGAVEQTLDVCPVHEDGQQANCNTKCCNHRLITMQKQETETKTYRAQNGT